MKKKYVLITGSSRGIGRACAVAFAKNGYHVFINCKNSVEQLAETEHEILASGGGCTALPGDVSDPDVVRSIFCKIKKVCQGVDVLVNNAGISHFGLLSDLSDSEWKNLIDTNLSSAFYCCREAIPHMVSEKCGKIINISSMWGTAGASCEAAYSASKSGLHGLTKALAKELAPSVISANAVACGVIGTDMNSRLNDEEKNAVTKVIRMLLKQTFVLERKYDKKSGRLVYNKEFRTIDLHQEFLREYFKISGIELRENLHLGVFYIEGETLIGEKISRLSTIYLLILKLLYDEHMAEASSNTSVYTSLGEIHEKINDFHLMKTLPSITEMRRSIALLKRYQIIEPLDVLEELNEETRMMIYPCVNVVLLGDDIRRLIESFSKEEVDSEFDEDEAAISGIIEDMPE